MRIKRGSVFEEIEYRILQALRVGMGRQMGRPAEKERGETLIIENPSMLQLAEAAKALYDWVGERLMHQESKTEHVSHTFTGAHIRGQIAAYEAAQQKMQTLFAGLIDFEQKQEKQKNGL